MKRRRSRLSVNRLLQLKSDRGVLTQSADGNDDGYVSIDRAYEHGSIADLRAASSFLSFDGIEECAGTAPRRLRFASSPAAAPFPPGLPPPRAISTCAPSSIPPPVNATTSSSSDRRGRRNCRA